MNCVLLYIVNFLFFQLKMISLHRSIFIFQFNSLHISMSYPKKTPKALAGLSDQFMPPIWMVLVFKLPNPKTSVLK